MILTVTLNAALDVTYQVSRLVPHTTHRVGEVVERPGGKGLNVSCVLAALGVPTTVTGLVGGRTGAALRARLAQAAPHATDALVPVAGTTRRTVAVVDASTGDTTMFNEPGPAVSTEEWLRFFDVYRELLDGARAVALCGSLPPGLPVGSYADLVRAARAAGVPVLLDTSGEPLRRGIAARPDLVKPNAEELAQLTGMADPTRAAHEARRRGGRAVVASSGPGGLLAVTGQGVWRAVPPERLAGNPTGAGDSAVAGLLSALVEGAPWPQRLARAVALSAATVRAATAGSFDRATYEALLPRVVVTEENKAA
ncbi:MULTISPECIES: 1-phosphofructokinase family hexose kinase [Streptomycetaceae]|uniref:1-phosphofructokinase family hexose kinase n=1 Tax=Streptomycetaceae TaxID=2062 RepID=UPI000213DA19|nr:1-phosphofructokinase family hexose kinase [Streptantibioticus cattleyicolor]MYS59435.1 hexose kinase [Streptomyces sp. SID5468]CCB75169.1 Sugar kinase [Streptantibioticus cattleyicolor NRRL 8057 = DSM 46488]